MDIPDHHQPLNAEALNRRVEEVSLGLAELSETIAGFLRLSNREEIQAQLRAVNESIRKLDKQRVPVPDGLRKLKISLASNDCKVEDVERLKARLVSDMNQALARLGNPIAIVPQPAAKAPRRVGKKQHQDDKILDLFSYRTG